MSGFYPAGLPFVKALGQREEAPLGGCWPVQGMLAFVGCGPCDSQARIYQRNTVPGCTSVKIPMPTSSSLPLSILQAALCVCEELYLYTVRNGVKCVLCLEPEAVDYLPL